MIRIKFCGMRREEDLTVAAALGIDAVGFIFYPKSPRSVVPELAKLLVATLPPFVTKVGVFVNLPPDKIAEIVQFAKLDLVQLSGDEIPEIAALIRTPLVKAFRHLPPESELQTWQKLDNFVAFLADGAPLNQSKDSSEAYDGRYGGSGMVAQESLILGLKNFGKVIIAGGLSSDTVAAAAAHYQPAAVDVSSGIESSPGIKDAAKMRAFVKVLRDSIDT